MDNSIEPQAGAAPAPTPAEIDRVERIITVGDQHLCRDGVAFAEALAETGCNHGTMNFGLILEVEAARNHATVEGPCPASLSAVLDFAEARGCAWVIIDQEGEGHIEDLPVYEDEDGESYGMFTTAGDDAVAVMVAEAAALPADASDDDIYALLRLRMAAIERTHAEVWDTVVRESIIDEIRERTGRRDLTIFFWEDVVRARAAGRAAGEAVH